MKIILPYTGDLDPRVTDACPEATPIELHSEAGYFETLLRFWRRKETLMVLEHDIVIHGTVLSTFADCEAEGIDWAHFPFVSQDYGMQAPKLGCTQFTAALMERHPDLMELVGTMQNDGSPARHWAHLDFRVFKALRSKDEMPYQCWPPVEHINPVARIKHHCVYGADCDCEMPNDGHGCPISFPGKPSTIVHYCQINELPWHLAPLVNMRGQVIEMPEDRKALIELRKKEQETTNVR